MSQPIDTLAIEIEANAANSVDGVRKLSRALTSLSKSISSVNGAGIGNVASSLNSMSNAFNGVGAGSQSAAGRAKKYTNTMPALINHTNKAAHSAKSLAYYFGKFYANMFMVIRGVKAFGKTISGTMGYMESFNFWDVAITSATGKTSEWKELGYEDATAYAEAFKKGLADFNQKMTGFSTSANGDISVSDTPNLGINLTDLTTFQAEIVSITSSLGLCTSVSKDTSKVLSMLAADMSSLKNINLKTVMTNFQSGLIGQSRALYKYGIDITNATLQTYAYQYGIEKAVSEMTQAEKMQLRMLAILDQSKVAWGDLANTLEQPANQFRVLKNGVKNLAITIGKLLMPMVSATLPYLNAMVNALQKFFTWTANILGIELNVENTGTGTTDIFDDIEDSAEDATDAVKKLKNSIRSFDELNVINTSSDSESSSDASIGGGIDLSQEINASLAEYEKAWEQAYSNIESRTKELSGKMTKFFEPVIDAIEKFAKGEISFGELAGTITGFTITNLEEALIEGLDDDQMWFDFGKNVYDFIVAIPWSTIFANGVELGKVLFKIIPDVVFGFVSTPITDIFTEMFGIDKEGAKKFIEQETKGKGGNIEFNYEFIMSCVLDYVKEEWNTKGEEINKWMDKNIFSLFSKEKWIKKGAEIGTGLGTAISNISKWCSDTKEEFTTWKTNVSTTISGWKEDAETKFTEWEENSDEIVSEWKENSEEKFDIWKTNVKSTFENWKSNTESKFSNWKGNTSSTIENWKSNIQGKFESWKSSTQSTFENWKTTVGAKISTWKSDTESKFNSFKTNTQNTISDWYSRISSFFGFDKWNFSGIKEGLSSAFNSAVSAVKRIWNTFANWLNDKLTWTIDPVKVAGRTLFDGTTISLGRIPTFANGGITSADIFAANENGVPELIGTIGRKSAIASGTEVTGIADAVYSTASEEMALLRQQNELLRMILEKPGLDNGDIFRAAKSAYRQEAKRLGAQGNPAAVWG